MNWGTYITITFVAFAVFMLSLVARTFTVNTDLVAEDYYNKELHFQNQIEKKSNFDKLNCKFIINQTEDGIFIQHPKALSDNFKSGTITIYRPSDAKLDQSFSIQPDIDGKQYIAAELNPGLYKFIIDWEGFENYYHEYSIMIH